MKSQSVSIDVSGSAMPCYLVLPDEDGARPAVIVLQEIFGVNTEVRRIADLLASSGYVALAINYYHRTDPDLNEPYTPAGLQKGFAAAGKVTRATMRADLLAAIDYLNTQDYVKSGHLGTWGFCYGGTDEYGLHAVEGRMHTTDLHATLLALMGLDHESLTYRYAGRDFRLTDVAGRVVTEIFS